MNEYHFLNTNELLIGSNSTYEKKQKISKIFLYIII